jgi:hypothetical protein
VLAHLAAVVALHLTEAGDARLEGGLLVGEPRQG